MYTIDFGRETIGNVSSHHRFLSKSFSLAFHKKGSQIQVICHFSFGFLFLCACMQITIKFLLERYGDYMIFPKKGTIIAPSSLHLMIYQKLYKQQGPSLDLQVLSLNGFFSFPLRSSNIDILYQYKQALDDLCSSNAFAISKHDINFLSACLNFMKWIKRKGIRVNDLSETSQKEIDLKEILLKLESITINDDHYYKMLQKNIDASDVYILRCEYSTLDQIFIDYLLDHGAKWLENAHEPEKHYFSTSNPSQQAKVIAKTIIDNDYDADDIFVIAQSPSDKQALAQAFDEVKIPYTFLNESSDSSFLEKFICLLTWSLKRDLSSFLSMIEQLYPQYFTIMQGYYTLFFDHFDTCRRLDQDYQPNVFIDEKTYIYWQEKEAEIQTFFDENSELFTTSATDFNGLFALLEKAYPTILEKDHPSLSMIQEALQESHRHIKSEEDLPLLLETLKKASVGQSAKDLRGIVIGSRKELSPLRDIVFYMSAHAKTFPNYSLETGIFNEAYIQNTTLPSMQERLDDQKKLLFTCLKQPKILYVSFYQSNYQQKSFEPSNDMNAFMQEKPTFLSIEQGDIFETRDFNIDPNTIKPLFFKEENTWSVSRFESFARCPYQHFLRYGLRLQEVKDLSDIRIRGSLLHEILEKATKRYKKDYCFLNKKDIESLVDEEFSFALELFLPKRKELMLQKQECIEKVTLIFDQMKEFENHWTMHCDQSEMTFNYRIPYQDASIDLFGVIDRVDLSSSSFCIFDYKTGSKDLSYKEFLAGRSLQLAAYTIAYENQHKKIPVGCFYVSLTTTPINRDAVTLKYTKSKEPWTESEPKTLMEDYDQNKKLNGWAFQDITLYNDEKSRFTQKKDVPTFEDMKDQFHGILEKSLDFMSSGYIMPEFTENACTYCAYKSICRNERTPKQDMEEEK